MERNGGGGGGGVRRRGEEGGGGGRGRKYIRYVHSFLLPPLFPLPSSLFVLSSSFFPHLCGVKRTKWKFFDIPDLAWGRGWGGHMSIGGGGVRNRGGLWPLFWCESQCA
jgi:hypothetical protein